MIVIALLVLFIIWYRISKPKKGNGYLYCGLFGCALNRELDDAVLEKLKTLGLFNQARGEDSCGYFNGIDIVKGVDSEKRFFDFVVSERVKLSDQPSRIFIGHTRKATYGSHTEKNAHPFNIEDRLIIAHNGTIENIWSLCHENDIPTADINVDSAGLGYLIDKVGWPILTKYKGAAALLVHRTCEPDNLYLFRGASRNYAAGDVYEERPLYYLEEEEGIYVSSLKIALEWIHKRKDDEKIKVVPHNQIIVIKNGVLERTGIHIIRDDANVYVSNYPPKKEESKPAVSGASPSFAGYMSGLVNKAAKPSGINVMYETYTQKSFSGMHSVYYWRGRYWLTVDNTLCEGALHINKQGKIVNIEDTSERRVATCYFFRGVMIKGDKEYQYLLNEIEKKANSNLYHALKGERDANFALWISWYSKYPVINIDLEAPEVPTSQRNVWYMKGKPVDNGAVTPLFAIRNYHFKSGNLVKISSTDDKETPFLLSSKEAITPDSKDESPWQDSCSDSCSAHTSLPDEMLVHLEPFDKVHKTYEDALDALQGIPFFALEEYAEDVITLLLQTQVTERLLTKVIDEVIYSAVYRSLTIKSLLDPQVSSIETYVFDAYEAWETSKDEDEKDEDDKDIEDIDYTDVTTNVAKAVEIFNKVKEDSIEDVKKKLQEIKVAEPVEPSSKIVRMYADADFDKLNENYEGEIVYDINDDSTKEEECGQAKLIIKEDVLKSMERLNAYADELSLLNASNFALETSHTIKMAVDSLRYSLYGLSTTHRLTDLTLEINKLNSLM